MQTQCNALEVQNRRLCDNNPQQAELLQLEREPKETRQENVQLSQTIIAIKAKLGEQEEQTGIRTDQLERSVEALTCEATALRAQLDAVKEELADEKRKRGSRRIVADRLKTYPLVNRSVAKTSGFVIMAEQQAVSLTREPDGEVKPPPPPPDEKEPDSNIRHMTPEEVELDPRFLGFFFKRNHATSCCPSSKLSRGTAGCWDRH